MPRIAAIDCGTNTVLLLVADLGAGGEIAVVDEQLEIVRLGEGLDATGRLADAAMARARGAFERYAARIAELGCEAVRAVATEGVRAAENGASFAAEIDGILGRACAGARLEIIDGEREARLSWRAVAASFPSLRGPRVVVDIGGGSTEILTGAEEVEGVVSIPIGSVRLTERLLPGDPPTAEERAALASTIDAALARAPALPTGAPVVGIAGTVTTLAAMALRLDTYDPARVHGHRLGRDELAALVETLARTPLAARKAMPGLDPRRADVIYAGACILLAIVDHARASACLVSDRGIRWGLIYEVAGLPTTSA
jgi:exopolyphosphatase/guanosine-5'-triphosphate,3'-diphosphate pyrophosphatase